MQIYTKEDISRAREMDLSTYLTYYDPGNLRHVSGTVYSTVEHDSLIFPTMGIFAKKMPYFIAFLLKNLSTYDEFSTDKCRILSYMKRND